eukprot:969093_1
MPALIWKYRSFVVSQVSQVYIRRYSEIEFKILFETVYLLLFRFDSDSLEKHSCGPEKMALTMKIAVVGPCKAGKTRISNFLGDLVFRSSNPAYDPTVAVRILEFDREILGRSSDHNQTEEIKVTVSLWDTSGDQKYESGWPAIKKDLNGVVIVYDSSKKSQEQEIQLWFDAFVAQCKMDPAQAIIIANLGDTDPREAPTAPKLSPEMAHIKLVRAGPVGDGCRVIKDAFAQFLGGVFGFHPDAEFD